MLAVLGPLLAVLAEEIVVSGVIGAASGALAGVVAAAASSDED